MIFVKISIIFLCIAGILLSMLSFGGTFLISFAYLLVGFATKFQNFWQWLFVLIFLIGLSILGEIIEFMAASWGSKKFGASGLTFFTTLIFGILGSIWGTILIPIIGTLIGAVFFACLAAFITELIIKNDFTKAFQATIGVLAGKTGSMLVKTLLSIFMTVIVLYSAFG